MQNTFQNNQSIKLKPVSKKLMTIDPFNKFKKQINLPSVIHKMSVIDNWYSSQSKIPLKLGELDLHKKIDKLN